MDKSPALRSALGGNFPYLETSPSNLGFTVGEGDATVGLAARLAGGETKGVAGITAGVPLDTSRPTATVCARLLGTGAHLEGIAPMLMVS